MKRNILFLFSTLLLTFSSFAQTAPAGVTAVQESTSSAKIKVTWIDPSANEDGYKVVIKNSSNVIVDSVIKAPNTITHTTASSLPAGVYSVVVSQYINIPLTFTPAAAVSVTIASFVFGQHTLSVELDQTTNNSAFFLWDATQSQAISGFDLTLVNLDAGGTVTRVIPFQNSYQWNNLTGNTRYSAKLVPFKITGGVKVYGNSSNTVFFTTKPNAPKPPSLVLLKNCPDEVLFQIVPQAGDIINEYVIQKSFTGGDPWIGLGSRAPYEPYLSDGETDVNQGANTVFYRVIAYNVTGNSISPVSSIAVNKYVGPPAAVGVFGDEITPSSITFKWTNPITDTQCGTNLIKEIAYRYSVNGGPEVQGGLFPGEQSFLIDGLNQKDTVKFEIWYFSPQGLISPIVGASARTLGPPDAPINPGLFGFVDSLGNYVVRIFANDAAVDEDGFEFYIGTSPELSSLKLAGKTKFVLGTGGDVFFFQKPLEEGVQYYYAIRAFNYLGQGNATKVLTNDPNNYTKAPNAPFNLKATAGTDAVVLTWRDDSFREAGFEIERSGDAGATYTMVGEVGRNILTYTDATATAGAAYSYRVLAVNPIGKSAASNVATVGTATAAAQGRIGVFPNPTTDLVNIKMPEKYDGTKGSIMLIDKNFREVYKAEIKFNAEGTSLDMTKFPEGMYNVIIITDDYKFSKKVQRF